MSHNDYQRRGTKRRMPYEENNRGNDGNFQHYTNTTPHFPQNTALLNTNNIQIDSYRLGGQHQNSFNTRWNGSGCNRPPPNVNPNGRNNQQNYQQNSRYNPPVNYHFQNTDASNFGTNFRPRHNSGIDFQPRHSSDNNFRPRHSNRGNRHNNPTHSNTTRHPCTSGYKRDVIGKPNIQWLSVDEEHLKAHPMYTRLPLPQCVSSIDLFTDLSRFSQDSVQWCTLHVGRLTTSKAAGALGIHEKTIAETLNIPRGLQGSRKSQESFQHLLDKSLFNSVGEAAHVLLDCPSDHKELDRLAVEHNRTMQELRSKYWSPWKSTSSTKWIMEYKGWCEKNQLTGCPDDISRVRLRWGGVHEATGLLAVLNYFHVTSGAVLHECGMFPGEALLENEPLSDIGKKQLDALKYLSSIGCVIGASPDGILVHKDGSAEVVEIKNHAPFGYSKAESGIIIRDREPEAEVPCMYVPQMQLEMFCVGPHCKSAILLRLTATQGATTMRLHRDDEYIELMLRQFALFYVKYVLARTPPPEDFSSEKDNGLLCNEVARKTKECAAKARLVVKLASHEIQRCKPHDIPLLL